MLKSSNRFVILLITPMFFLWRFVLNLGPISTPHLKKACQLTDAQSYFIDSTLIVAKP